MDRYTDDEALQLSECDTIPLVSCLCLRLSLWWVCKYNIITWISRNFRLRTSSKSFEWIRMNIVIKYWLVGVVFCGLTSVSMRWVHHTTDYKIYCSFVLGSRLFDSGWIYREVRNSKNNWIFRCKFNLIVISGTEELETVQNWMLIEFSTDLLMNLPFNFLIVNVKC